MSDSEGRIAPVTYLFGTPQETVDTDSSIGSPSTTQQPTTAQSSTAQQSSGVQQSGWYVDNADAPQIAPPRLATPSEETARLYAARQQLVLAEEEAARPLQAREEAAAAAQPRESKRVGNVSMHALARRGMSSAEMTRLLESRELEPDEVAAEVERLEGAGLLDDHALAENLVRTLQDRKGLGRSAVSAELRRRKIDDGAISEVMEQIEGDDELARATAVAIKRAGQLQSYDPQTARRRLGAYLQRRGYGGSVLSAAISAALDGNTSNTGPRFR